jgi:glycerol-3-phosphate acyltransferase PlsX
MAEIPLKIAVDATGGDFAPGEAVAGSIQAARELGIEIALTGPLPAIEAELGKLDTDGLSISTVAADELIEEGEQPAVAVMHKRNNPIAVAARLVKQGEANAMLSAGPTGAVMVAALQYLGSLPGIDRPVAGGLFLHLSPKTVMLDLGANVGCQPYQMVNFAVVGIVYARSFLGIKEPTVGLLNVGAEEGKGTDFARESYKLLKESGLNFTGNVEGMDIVTGKANVIVCDGFTGNILIKFSEALGRAVSGWLKKELKDSLPAAELEKATGTLYRMLSPGEVLGGGPLLGVDGVACIAHGASRAAQIAGTIRQAKQALDSGFVETLKRELERFQVKK